MDAWHYVINGKQHGPVSGPRLKQMANRGDLLPSDLVWCEGWVDWHQAREVDELIGPNGVIVRDDRGIGLHEPPEIVEYKPGHPAQATLIDCNRCGRSHFVDCGPCPSVADAARETAMADAA